MTAKAPRRKVMEKNVFVTGITGFAGRHLARLLINRGLHVSGIGLHAEDREGEYQVTRCNLLDRERLQTVLENCRPQWIFHLAGLTHPRQSLRKPAPYYRTNVNGTVNLLESVRTLQLDTKILMVSSSEVYRPPAQEELLSENAPLEARNPYASSKILAESVALQYRYNFQSRVVIARPFNHFGPGQREGFVVADFCSQAACIEKGMQPPRIQVGNLAPVRDFLDVRDVVRAYVDLLREGKEGEIYNICSGEGTSIRHLLELVRQKCRKPFQVEEAAGRIRHDCRRIVGDNRKIRRLIGFKADYRLEESIEDTLEYWRGQLGKPA